LSFGCSFVSTTFIKSRERKALCQKDHRFRNSTECSDVEGVAVAEEHDVISCHPSIALKQSHPRQTRKDKQQQKLALAMAALAIAHLAIGSGNPGYFGFFFASLPSLSERSIWSFLISQLDRGPNEARRCCGSSERSS
jgi:hypothetical protein